MSAVPDRPRQVPRIVVAAVASGAGKTTITAGLIRALRQQGLIVQPFKCGPDYIDPSYLERAAGRPCRNLDAWMLDDAQLLAGFSRASRDADIAVIEGVMGLFDGSRWDDERASTAQIAKLLRAPVLLVVDISGAARSVAAVVLGCRHFDPDLALRGVVLNFAGSAGHAKGCGEAITAHTGLAVLGWLPRAPRLAMPERHLGLVPGGEHPHTEALIAEIAAEIAQRIDLGALVAAARSADALPPMNEAAVAQRLDVPASVALHIGREPPIVAVARDEAFCFYYPENLELLAEAGAVIKFFSPVRGQAPDPLAAGVYLGGGYPELHGPALAANVTLWRTLRELHARDAPIYAECGGFMVLTQALIDREGSRWPMAGLVGGETRMTEKLAALGYRHALALRPNLLAEGGRVLRGHEFRYSTWSGGVPAGAGAAWQVSGTRAAAPDSMGFVEGNLLASYLHIHFGQHADIAGRFVRTLRASMQPMPRRQSHG